MKNEIGFYGKKFIAKKGDLDKRKFIEDYIRFQENWLKVHEDNDMNPIDTDGNIILEAYRIYLGVKKKK